jgi:hypothetical protein
MGVQALDTLAGAADTAGRARSDMGCRNRCIPFSLVGSMCFSNVDWVKIDFRLADTADCIDTTHGPHQVNAHEVVAGGHRGAIAEEWGVANHDRVTLCSADHNIEGTSRWAPN